MEEKSALSKAAMHINRGCLVVSVQAELYDELILQIQEDILEKIKETGVKGVIIDLSIVGLIDSFIGQTICDTARMASMLGAKTVLIGLRPEVVVSLIDLDLEFGDIKTALTLEYGFRILEPIVLPKEEIEEVEEEAEEDVIVAEGGIIKDEVAEDLGDDEELQEEEVEDET